MGIAAEVYGKMDRKRCYEILDLNPGASLEEIKAAYRDAVAVWHPDRFVNNPRLKRKAEAKLKDINDAYKTLLSYESKNEEAGRQSRSKEINVEMIAETGTRLFLHACNFIIKKLKGS